MYYCNQKKDDSPCTITSINERSNDYKKETERDSQSDDEKNG